MFDHRVALPYWRRHPLLTAAGLSLACWALLHGWYGTVTIVVAAATLTAIRRHRHTAARRRVELRARADYEHLLSLAGDPRGLYGRFPPVQAGWFPDPARTGRWRYFDGAFWTGYVTSRR